MKSLRTGKCRAIIWPKLAQGFELVAPLRHKGLDDPRDFFQHGERDFLLRFVPQVDVALDW